MVVVLVGNRPEPVAPPVPDPLAITEPQVVGPIPFDDASTQPTPPADPAAPPTPGQPAPQPLALPREPLLLPLPPPGPPAPPPLPVPPAPPAPPPPPTGLSGPAAAVVSITNARRAAAGCKPLKVDQRLNRSAQGHANDMARNRFFSHSNLKGQRFGDRERAAGYFGGGGENIARGQDTAAEVMGVWMNSPTHRKNILNCEFTTIGIGYVPAGRYWVQNFGR